MKADLAATKRSLSFRAPPSVSSVDVLVDGHRVWSTGLPTPGADDLVRLPWPRVLRPYLRGRATITVRDSATEDVLAQSPVRIGHGSRAISVRNSQGRWLAVNKWQRMGVSVEGDVAGLTDRLLGHAKTLVDQLQQLGYATSITSGTLLGAVRRADILPHDDDIDLSILLDESDPADLSLASFRLEDRLIALGYTVVRHSSAHLQVLYLFDNGDVDHYIDIFSAFFRGADFCQPFHIRTPVPRSSVVPRSTMTVAGVDFPAPVVPEDWLAACYGPGWAVPDPSFRFETPLATRRRFDSWFGSQNMNRTYWESHYASLAASEEPDADRAFLRSLSRILPVAAPVVDLGCGTGSNANVVAAHGHDVIGVDYSYRALSMARSSSAENAEYRYVNLYDRRRLLEFGAELVQSGRGWHFALAHVLEGLTEEGRENVLLFLRLVMPVGSFALAMVDTNFLTRNYRGENAETWHLPVERLRDEALDKGLDVEVRSTGFRRTAYGRRRTATVLLTKTGADER